PANRDGIPSLAEQKALRAEQEEVNERTKMFDRKHPELDKLKDEEKLQKLAPQDQAELREIREDQKKVRELALKLFAAAKKGQEGENQRDVERWPASQPACAFASWPGRGWPWPTTRSLTRTSRRSASRKRRSPTPTRRRTRKRTRTRRTLPTSRTART